MAEKNLNGYVCNICGFKCTANIKEEIINNCEAMKFGFIYNGLNTPEKVQSQIIPFKQFWGIK